MMVYGAKLRGLRATGVAGLGLMLVNLTSCLGDNVCGKEMEEQGGYCVIPSDSESESASDMDGGDAGGDSETADENLPSGLGDPCTAHEECTLEADYCLQPNFPDLNGFCTVEGCSLDPDDCPGTYSCMDLSIYLPTLPTVCVPPDIQQLRTPAEGGVR